MSGRISVAGDGSFIDPVEFSFASGSGSLSALPLTEVEERAFHDNLDQLARMESLERSLSDLLLADREMFRAGAELAKSQFDGAAFAGSSAAGSSEIGMQLIRAVTVMNPGIGPSGTPVLGWSQTYRSPGWQSIFGSPFNPVDLSQYGTGKGPTYTRGRVMLLIDALFDSSVPILPTEFDSNVDGVTYPVGSLAWLPVVDLAYYKLPYPLLIPVDGHFYMRGNIQSRVFPAVDSTQLLGITYATGSYLSGEA